MSKRDFNKVAKQLYSIKHLDLILHIHFSRTKQVLRKTNQENFASMFTVNYILQKQDFSYFPTQICSSKHSTLERYQT